MQGLGKSHLRGQTRVGAHILGQTIGNALAYQISQRSNSAAQGQQAPGAGATYEQNLAAHGFTFGDGGLTATPTDNTMYAPDPSLAGAQTGDIVVTATRRPTYVDGQLIDPNRLLTLAGLGNGPFGGNKPGATILIGGAGNDSDNSYLPLWVKAFDNAGITDAIRSPASLSEGLPLDVLGIEHSNYYFGDQFYDGPQNPFISSDFNPIDLNQFGQLNIVGYSWGAVQAAQRALELTAAGQNISNLVLIGAPINQSLLDAVKIDTNIGNATVINLTSHGDPIYAGMSDIELDADIPKLASQMFAGTGHFYYSQTGSVGQARDAALANYLYKIGLR